MTPDVPASFAALAPELLISEEWNRMPPLPQPWPRETYNTVIAYISAEKWRTLSAYDWLMILSFVSIGIGVIHQVVEIVRAQRADR